MIVLSKEEAPLNEIPYMVPNDRYIGEHGAKPQSVYNFLHILRGYRPPSKRFLLNISICVLVKKLKHEKEKGAVNEADKAYEPSYVAQTICTLFAWFLDNYIWYKCAEFTGIQLQHSVSCFLFPYLYTCHLPYCTIFPYYQLQKESSMR
jgi:uncharacterized membrane protein YhdT